MTFTLLLHFNSFMGASSSPYVTVQPTHPTLLCCMVKPMKSCHDKSLNPLAKISQSCQLKHLFHMLMLVPLVSQVLKSLKLWEADQWAWIFYHN